MINAIQILQKEVVKPDFDIKKFGRIFIKEYDDLIIFKYNYEAQFTPVSMWNEFELACRGLILNKKTGEVVALPFSKFTNLFECGLRPHYSDKLIACLEKLDGSLGILYRHNNKIKVATTGNFHSEQAIWAEKYLADYYDLSDLPNELTLVFEIICKSNDNVVRYEQEDLVLLSAFDRFNQKELNFITEVVPLANKYGFTLPSFHTFTSVEDLIAEAGMSQDNIEGWILLYEDIDGNYKRFKVKTDLYIEKHLAINNNSFTYRQILDIIKKGNLAEVYEVLPERTKIAFDRMSGELLNEFMSLEWDAHKLTQDLRDKTRKDIGLVLKKNKLKPIVFMMIDGKDYAEYIWKMVLEKIHE